MSRVAGGQSVRSSRTVMILVAIAACEPAPEASNQRGELDPVIEVRLVSEEAAPGLETMLYEGETVHLDPVPVLSDTDLVHGRWADRRARSARRELMDSDPRDAPRPPRLLRRLARLLTRGRDAPYIVPDLDASFAGDIERGLRRGRATARYSDR